VITSSGEITANATMAIATITTATPPIIIQFFWPEALGAFDLFCRRSFLEVNVDL
jgi:hypothetical protein